MEKNEKKVKLIDLIRQLTICNSGIKENLKRVGMD